MLLKSYVSFLSILSLSCLIAGQAQATETDNQIWTSIIATTAFAPQIDATLEFHNRFTENTDTLGQRLIRPSVTYKIHDNLSITAGYLYGTFNTSSSTSFHEQRLWEQVGYVLLRKQNGLIISGRTRLEQRYIENKSETGWRLRQQLRLEMPIIETGQLKGLTWNETFIGLNNTAWGQRGDFDQTRTFIGFAIPLTKNASIEPGYINQIISRSGENRLNHIASVSFSVRF